MANQWLVPGRSSVVPVIPPDWDLRPGATLDLERGVVHLYRRAAKQVSVPWWLMKGRRA
jgi:hypothetical protein